MALYRVGQASMDANGVVTGYGTKWMEPLSLIRKEATMMFLTAQGIHLAVISEIISNTEIRAIATGGAVVARTDYAILIHDSLTVDGMAQDVAETLRYYRSKESEFAHLIEVIEDLDMVEIEKKVTEMRDLLSKSNAVLLKVEGKAAEVQLNANKVASELAEVQKLHGQTTTLKDQAQQSAKAAEASKNAAAAEVTKAAAEVAKSKTEADRSKTEADRAASLANQIDPSKLARIDRNLADLTDKTAARRNLSLDRFQQSQGLTLVASPDDSKVIVAYDDGRWGYYNRGTTDAIALAVNAGGTGARDAATARVNIGAAAKGVNNDITETTALKNIRGASRVEFLRSDLGYDIESMRQGGNIADRKGLRKFRGAGGSQIWHEMVSNIDYTLHVGLNPDVEIFRINSSNGVFFKGNKIIEAGDYGIGAVNSPQLTGAAANARNNRTGLYTVLTNDNELGTAFGIQGQAVGVVNFGLHHTQSDQYKGQLAGSYSTNGRLFYRCSDAGTWRAWKEVATTGVPLFNFGSGLNVTNTQGSQTYVTFKVENKGRPSTDNGSQVSIEIPNTTTRPYLLQRRNDGTFTDQIVNTLPTIGGELLCRNNYVLNMANKNFNDLANTQFVSFLSGGTTHGAQNTPNVGYGNMLVIGSGGATTGNYTTQLLFDKSTAIPYTRCRTDVSAAWTAWQKVTVAAVSDENLKNIKGKMNVEGALDNINRMEFKIFSFKEDETQRYRRGVISQQIRKIDKDYVNIVGDRMVLDQTPMMLDGLAAIKALRARDEANKERISNLEKKVEQLEAMLYALMSKPETLD